MLATFGVLQVFWSMLWFFLFFMWIMLLFRIVIDIFRDTDSSGFAKVLWIIFLFAVPFLGAFVYIIVNGGKMANREVASLKAQDEAARAYIKDAAGVSSADELHRLAELKDKGVISDEEFAALKAKVIG